METFKDYDVEKCKRHHYHVQSLSIYYGLYEFINNYSTQGEKCRSKTMEKYCGYTTLLQSISYILTLLLIIVPFISHPFDVLRLSMILLSMTLSVFISLIPLNYFPKYNELDITLILLKKELRSFMWILGFTKFDEYNTWRDNSISNRLFKTIVERVKYACIINQDFNTSLLTWINTYCVDKRNFSTTEIDEKLRYIIKTRDNNNELIRLLQLVMVTEINDICAMFNGNNKEKIIPQEYKWTFEHCKDAWTYSLTSLLTKRNSKFKHTANKTHINELIATIYNGLYDIDNKFNPLADAFITKKYRDYIINPKRNFDDSLTAF